MLEEKLKAIIPSSVKKFDKFDKEDPYHFDKWALDKYKQSCMYYWFKSRDGSRRETVP